MVVPSLESSSVAQVGRSASKGREIEGRVSRANNFSLSPDWMHTYYVVVLYLGTPASDGENKLQRERQQRTSVRAARDAIAHPRSSIDAKPAWLPGASVVAITHHSAMPKR